MSLRLLLGTVAAAATLAACSDSDVSFGGSSDSADTAGCPAGLAADSSGACTTLNGVITQSVTLTAADSPYTLTGPLEVGRDLGGDGLAAGGVSATITIEPGVEIRGQNPSDYFLVSRGSRIIARGTPDAPIIFTSVEAATTGATQSQQWGGLVILGQAPINLCDVGTATPGAVDCENRIEGIEETRKYGGDQSGDSSGVLSYIQVRYAGFDPDGSGSELNGITLGGVGSGTELNHIQIHRNFDDGIEFFGGTADASYLVLSENRDDSVDLDLGYDGNLQYILVLQADDDGDQEGDNLFELSSEGSASSNIGETDPNIANFTALGGNRQGGNGIRMNQGFIGSFFNGIVTTSSPTGGDGGGSPCFRWEDAGNDDATFDGEGVDPTFLSVAFSCVGGVTDSDSDANGITVAPLAIAAGGNVGTGTATAYTPGVDYTPTAADGFVNTAAEAAGTIPPATFPAMSGLDTDGEGYIGAVENTSDTWWSFACGIDVTSSSC